MNLSTMNTAVTEGFSRLKALLSIGQQKRLLQIETALPSATLVVERAQWREDVSGLSAGVLAPLTPLVAEVDCLSTSALLSLKALIGEQMSLRLMCADGRYRTWHGYVAQAAQLGSDGGLARYRLQLVAFTHLLGLRQDTRVFLAQRADTIITSVLRAYPQANFRIDVSAEALAAAPLRGTTTQYRETDAAFVQRLLSEEGWNWRLEHADDDRPLSEAKTAKHCLVISDAQAQRLDLGSLRFGKPDVRRYGLAEDTITAIALERQVSPNAVTLAAWDARQLAGVGTQLRSSLPNGEAPTLEHYQGHGERRYVVFDAGDDQASSALADHHGALALARHELSIKTLHGESAVRRLAAGADFSLTEHSRYGAFSAAGDNRFVVLAIQHEAVNNLGSEAAQILKSTELEAGSYRNHYTAAPAAAKLVPHAPVKPRAPGVQTALVVGHDGDSVTTERDLRVRVQFPWQRGARPLAGGLTGPLTPGQDETGHATGDAAASQWVRVAQPSAGANWGAVFTPRIGTEVLVEFIEGDPDRPLIVGQLHNGQDSLPWPAGVDSGANHPGTLSGWHSHTLDDEGCNQWVIDDATGQLRMRLASQSSGSPWSELSLGHVISQGAQSAQRGAWLGSGFYAHTDGWASVRAGQGLLISTSERAGSYGSAQSTQMDAQEAVAQLKGAQQLGQALSQAAQAQGALSLSSHDANDQEALQGVLDAIDPKLNGKHASEKKAQGRNSADPVEQFAQPYLVFDTPSTAITASPATLASYSGRDTTLVAQNDVHAAAAHTSSWVSGETTSLYTHQGELQAMAANGNFSLRAHTDALELLADKDITVISVNDEITITAKERIEMVGGDSKVVLNGANIEFVTPGSFTVKAASHAWAGGADAGVVPAKLPSELMKIQGVIPGTFKSTFVRDQLKRFATEADETIFISDMAQVFGADIPLEAYRSFYAAAKAGMPELRHVLGHGGDAVYDVKAKHIWVNESLAVEAVQGDEQAQWELLDALVRAWSDFIAHKLRNEWSRIGGHASIQFGGAYVLGLLDLAGQATTTYAQLHSPQASGPLQVQHGPIQRSIRNIEAAYMEARDQSGREAIGYKLHDGVYRPDRDGPLKLTPVFDAKMMKDDPHVGVHSHHTIEQTLRADRRFQDFEIGMIYYGNWLRDWSQVCDGFMLPPGVKGTGLSRENLTTFVMLMGQVVASTYLPPEVWSRAKPIVEFQKSRLMECMELLGCYRPEEHMDNPAGLPDSRPHSYPAGWLVDLPVDKRMLEVDSSTSMRRYIGDGSMTGAYPSSLVYMQRQLRKACELGKTPRGLIHLGSALHVLEDYFAHTNFVELALHKAKYRTVVSWVPHRDNLKDMPITTGQFATKDMLFSLMYKMADVIAPVSQTGDHMTKVHYEGLELGDWLVWALLNDSGRIFSATAFKGYCQAMYRANDVIRGKVPESIRSRYQEAKITAYGSLAAAMKNLAGARLRQPQIDGYDFDKSIDPSHTMVAKDANDHPLHALAAELAGLAVLDMGKAVADVWDRKLTIDQALARANQYFVHPANTSLFDKEIAEWAIRNPAKIRAASDRKAALKRSEEHEHHEHHEKQPLPKQYAQAWQFWNKHYTPLTGQPDFFAPAEPVATV
jgi:type VI secretion system secreted protein VgrG